MANPKSRFAVVSALVCNGLVACVKFVAFAFTGSGAMLSEAIHSVADTLNQALLLAGIVLSSRKADEAFAYGYRAERYVWALMSAVGIFFLGCGVTVYHGVASLIAQHHPEGNLAWAIGVLILSFMMEGYVLGVAIRHIKHASGDRPFFAYLRDEADPSVAAVLLEDAAACLGILIALSAILLTHVTGKFYWDALGSILVGLLLGGVAIWLIIRNRNLLIGPSVPTRVRRQLRQILQSDPAVEEIVDLRTRIMDTDTYRVAADLRFDGRALSERLKDKLTNRYKSIETLDDFHEFAAEYADDIIDALAQEIDTLEQRVRDQVPKARYLDFEAD